MNWREQVTDPELVRTAIEVDREKVVGAFVSHLSSFEHAADEVCMNREKFRRLADQGSSEIGGSFSQVRLVLLPSFPPSKRLTSSPSLTLVDSVP